MDTKEKLLDAAEELFADHGFASTSLRDITTEADVNLAAVNYHFGSKLDLLRAVFARRIGPVNAERLERFDALDDPDVEEVLRAFIAPLFKRLREPGNARGSGLKKNDILLKIDGKAVTTLDDVQQRHKTALGDIGEKHRIVLTVLRDGLMRHVVLDFSRDYEKEE